MLIASLTIFLLAPTGIIQSYASDDSLSIISFDKEWYSWTDKVYITINASHFNQDYGKIEQIGGGSNSEGEITIKTSNGKLEEFELTETSPSSGIFSGSLLLTGSSHIDANGDKNKGDVPGITSDSGPISQLAAIGSDTIIVIFENEYEDVEASAKISWSLGEFAWMPKELDRMENILISVYDEDMNFNNERRDTINVMASSENTQYSKKLKLLETFEDSGAFEGYLKLSSEKEGLTTIKTTIPDTLYIKYSDYTIPSDISSSQYYDVILEIDLVPHVPDPEDPRYFSQSSATTPQQVSVGILYSEIDKHEYTKGENIALTGEVEDPNSKPISILVKRPDGSIVMINQISHDPLGNFETNFDAAGPMWNVEGTYTINVTHDNGRSVQHEFMYLFEQSETEKPRPPTANQPPVNMPQNPPVPEWIRANAAWWVEDKIDDQTFVSGLQFMITEEILVVPETIPILPGDPQSDKIPEWLKNNVDWWTQGLLSDDDFLKGIEYMVTNRIIVI